MLENYGAIENSIDTIDTWQYFLFSIFVSNTKYNLECNAYSNRYNEGLTNSLVVFSVTSGAQRGLTGLFSL